MSDSYENKYAAALSELKASAISRGTYLPAMTRMLRRFGRPRPPHYNSFFFNAISAGLWFGPAWGLTMWFTGWAQRGLSVTEAVISAGAAGILFGLSMATYYRLSARRHGLSRWDSL